MGHQTIMQFCRKHGLSRYAVDRLLANGELTYFTIGTRKLIPDDAWDEYVERKKVTPWEDETKVQNSDFSKSAVATTSPGLKTVAAGSAARARQIAESLKARSRSSSTAGNEKPGRAAPMRS